MSRGIPHAPGNYDRWREDWNSVEGSPKSAWLFLYLPRDRAININDNAERNKESFKLWTLRGGDGEDIMYTRYSTRYRYLWIIEQHHSLLVKCFSSIHFSYVRENHIQYFTTLDPWPYSIHPMLRNLLPTWKIFCIYNIRKDNIFTLLWRRQSIASRKRYGRYIPSRICVCALRRWTTSSA